jgi:hypothetical protein
MLAVIFILIAGIVAFAKGALGSALLLGERLRGRL